MNYYEIALLKSPLGNLTYKSDKEILLGLKVLVPLARRKNLQEGVVVKKTIQPSFKCIEIVETTQYYYNGLMLKTAKFISQYYVCSYGEALAIYSPFDINLSLDIKKNIIKSDIILSEDQKKAYSFLEKNTLSLLFADTGSGKTEIYIKHIEKQLNKGFQAVLLMPEISLSAQMEKRLKKVFKNDVAIWHSKIQKKKKEEILKKLQLGEIKIIAGARSALFLPYKKLGLIVIDEEHDDSYKNDFKPRLNAKNIAMYVSKTFNIQTILGSATPSSTSFLKTPYYRLKKTFFSSNKKFIFEDNTNNITPLILDKINETLINNNQIIIFLPTRANFKYQVCSNCGKAVQCPFCSVAMSLHKNIKALKCHYCGYTQKIPDLCPICGQGHIKNLRVGTAQVEEELKEIFHNKTIKRFDRDTIKTDKQLKNILSDFNNKEIDILIGTQMLSKGHDYHNVKLAIILGIDSIINMNSYKARESALSLLIQISGRSGRKGNGDIIIQTKNKDFFSYYLEEADYEDFLKEELSYRIDLYPPYLKLARIIFLNKNAFHAKKEMEYYLEILKKNENIDIVGSGESSIFKIANNYRYEILVRSNKLRELLKALHNITSPMAVIDMDTLY